MTTCPHMLEPLAPGFTALRKRIRMGSMAKDVLQDKVAVGQKVAFRVADGSQLRWGSAYAP